MKPSPKTPLRIWHTGKPSMVGGKVLPMLPVDEEFHRLRRERKEMGK